jgi:hypothetical protein
MSKRACFVAFSMLILASLACSLPGAASPSPVAPARESIPTFTPPVQNPEKPTEPPPAPTLTPEPTALQPQVRALDPRMLSGCEIFLDADFPNTVGSVPAAAELLSDANSKACQYTFDGGTIFASISTSLPGREAFENVRQFDGMAGATIEPITLGEMAVFKVFEENRVALEAVLNGWYVVLDAQGFDRKHLLLLAELLIANLIPYYPAP